MNSNIKFETVEPSYKDKYGIYMCECDICLNPKKYIKRYYIITDINGKTINLGTHRNPHCVILAPNKYYVCTLASGINPDLDEFEIKEVKNDSNRLPKI